MDTVISIQQKNQIQEYIKQSFQSLQQEELVHKCDEISRKLMPILVEIVNICSKPGSSIGSICCEVIPAPFINIYDLPQDRYGKLIIRILQDYCGIKLIYRPISTFGWNQGSRPIGFVIASDQGALKRPPPFLINESLQSYINQNPTDFILKCGEMQIPVHQFVLRSQCPYFEALFNNDMIEKSSNLYEVDNNKLKDSETDVESFKRIISFLYAGQLSFSNLSHLEVGRLMACANLYSLNRLKEACAFELFQRLLKQDLGEEMDDGLMLIVEMVDQKLYGLFQMMKDLRDNFI